MKRMIASMILLALSLSLLACIRVEPTTDVQDGTDATQSIVSEPDLQPPIEPYLPPWTNAEAARIAFDAYPDSRIVDSSRAEYSYEEMVADLAQMQALYADFFSYRSYGTSADGRALYVATLGDPNAPNSILVSAGIHGREYLTPLLVMKQMEFYLYYYRTGECGGTPYSSLFSQCCFYVVPMTNPDGIMLSQAGIDSLRSAQLRQKVMDVYRSDFSLGLTSTQEIDSYLQYWKANATGTDLNRNFDALWDSYGGMRAPSHKNYKGPTAESEPETRALAALTDSIPGIRAVLCIHSQGEVLYWNCGQDPTLASRTRAFAAMLADRNGYEIIDERNNDASYSDWCALKRGLIAITVETGLGICPLFIDKFPTIWQDQFDLLPLSALYFLRH